MILGSRFLLIHITRLMHTEREEEFNIQSYLTQNLVKQCLLAVTTLPGSQPRAGDEKLKETFRLYWPHNPHPPSSAILSSFSLQDAARQLLTNVTMMCVTTFEARHRK
jgi:hypothetical protein